MAETFNGWILSARHKTIITMLEEIRVQVMHRHTAMRAFCETRWTTNISPMALKYLTKNTSTSMRCRVDWNGDAGFEVVHGDYRHVVDLKKETCSCRSWGLKRIPCAHAIAAMHLQKKDPINYVSAWYGKEMFQKTYGHFIQPVLNMIMWPESQNSSIDPPKIKVMPGRPKKNRRKARDEVKKTGKLTKRGSVMTCSNCKNKGHNKRGCPLLKNSASQGVSENATQGSSSTIQPAAEPNVFRAKHVNVPRNKHRARGPPNTLSSDEPVPKKNAPTAYKRPKMSGVGVFISEKTGFTCAQNLAGERTVISAAPRKIKNSADVTGDVGFHPQRLKWKGPLSAAQLKKNAVERVSQMRIRAAARYTIQVQLYHSQSPLQLHPSQQLCAGCPEISLWLYQL